MYRAFPLLFAAAAMVAGCSDTDGRYPSLLPRSIESQSLAEPVRPVPVATPDAALDARIAEALTTVDTARAAFVAAAQTAEARIAVARGTAAGTERWLDAQAALGRVDATRAPVITQLAELEKLAIARGEAAQPPYPALDTAIETTAAVHGAQAERIATLENAFGG